MLPGRTNKAGQTVWAMLYQAHSYNIFFFEYVTHVPKKYVKIV